ncbi:hypothetical protein PsWM33_01193 [Pseudovibrio sp. WM33]|nr:hypothetical protein PsWM33_01193 [Pseudovibrio sp. WM33]
MPIHIADGRFAIWALDRALKAEFVGALQIFGQAVAHGGLWIVLRCGNGGHLAIGARGCIHCCGHNDTQQAMLDAMGVDVAFSYMSVFDGLY